MEDSSVSISSVGSMRNLVQPNLYLNFFKITAILMVMVIAISLIKNIKNRKYIIVSVVTVLMAIVSYCSYNYIEKNIWLINGREQLKCGFQIACSYVAMIVNIICTVMTGIFIFKKGTVKKNNPKEEDINSEQKNS